MSYVAGTTKWGGGIGTPADAPVTWSANYFDALTVDPDSTESEFDAALQQAFDRWENVAAIDFEFDNSGAPTDITIGARPFEFPVAGLARVTSSGNEITDADVFFSTNIEWAPFGSGAPDFFGDFFAVALHEIGHAIGLVHVDDTSEIMNATIFASDLGNGDIAAAQFLYSRDDEDAPLADAEQVEAPPEGASGEDGGGGGGAGIVALLLGVLAAFFGFGPAGAAVAAGALPIRNSNDDEGDTLANDGDAPLLSELVPVTEEHVVYTGDYAGHTGLPGCGCNACHQMMLEDEEPSLFL